MVSREKASNNLGKVIASHFLLITLQYNWKYCTWSMWHDCEINNCCIIIDDVGYNKRLYVLVITPP